jgi:hypothetical protein
MSDTKMSLGPGPVFNGNYILDYREVAMYYYCVGEIRNANHT